MNDLKQVLMLLQEQLKSITYKRESYTNVPDNEIDFMVSILKRSNNSLQQFELQYQSIVDEISNLRSKVDYEIDVLEEVLTDRIMKRND